MRAILIAAAMLVATAHGQMFAQRFGGALTPRVPTTYREVEYIQAGSVAGPYLVIPFPVTQCRIEYRATHAGSTSATSLFGHAALKNGVGTNLIQIGTYAKTQWNVDYRRVNGAVDYNRFGSAIFDRSIDFSVDFRSDGMSFATNGVTIRTDTTTPAVGLALFSGVFARINYDVEDGVVDSISDYAIRAKLFSCTVYVGSETFSELIPCVRRADNKPGMWDTVSKQFFANAGTGEFAWGELP